MRLRIKLRLRPDLVDTGLLCAVGLSIGLVVGFLNDPTPFGDDAIFHVGAIRSLASNFPLLGWDPHAFAGYVPSIGFNWLLYLPPAVFVRAGFDALSSFHVAFVCAFLLFGLSIYYFAKSVGSGRIVSMSMPILAWSTNAYWNLTVWGGAYGRAFTIPMVFLALGATYRYVSHLNGGRASSRDYWLGLSLWTLTYAGDAFPAIAGTCLGLIFVLLSPGLGNLVSGLKRIGSIFLPAVSLMLWQLVPLLFQALLFGPYRNQYTVANSLSLLLIPGGTWVSTLNAVYLPLILSLGVICILTRVRASLAQRAFLIAVSVMVAYWIIMGWIPALWPYLPRLMATYNSVENLAWLFLMGIPILFAMLRRHIETVGRTLLRISVRLPFTVNRYRLVTFLEAITLLAIVANAVILLPAIKPVNAGPMTDQLNAAFDKSLGHPSNDYRVSLQNRVLTRSFFLYQPNRFDTGGRAELLNPDPFFNSWYMTDVFYKNDLSAIGTVYIDDQPSANVSSLLESSNNFAGEKFWLDWYAVNAAAFYDITFDQIIGNYSARPFLFSVSGTPTTSSVPEIIVKPQDPTPVLTATNATIVGFYSFAENSQSEYNSLISILASMGLSARFVIPLYLHSIQDVLTASIDALVTDSYTYAQYSTEMKILLRTSNIVMVSSTDGQPGSQSVISQEGNRVLVNTPLSFQQLVSGREDGSYYFAKSAPIVGMNSFNASSSTYQGGTSKSLSPSSWAATFTTPNAQGTLQTAAGTLTINVTSTDTSQRSQFNVQSHLSSIVPLSRNLTISILIQTTADIALGISFTPPTGCCSNYVALDQEIASGNPVQLNIPYSTFYKWANSSSMFGVTQDLTLAINLPSGHPNVTVRVSNVSLSAPAYTISTLPTPISPANDGVLNHDPGVTGIGLLNRSNASTTILNLPSGAPQSITPLGSLMGGSKGEEYDKIITTGGNSQTGPMVVLFSQPSSSLVSQEWIDNQDMVASSIPRGFHGLLWKETYSQLWNFEPESGSIKNGLIYYFAGPGMIYIPMPLYADGIKASFLAINPESVTLFSIPIATIATLVLSRKRIPAFGRSKTMIAEQVEKS